MLHDRALDVVAGLGVGVGVMAGAFEVVGVGVFGETGVDDRVVES